MPRKQSPEISEAWLRRRAEHYIARYAPSSTAVSRVLTRAIHRHAADDAARWQPVIARLVAEFERQGLLDDHRYACAKAEALRRRGSSAQTIRAKLMQAGLPSECISAALAAADAEAPDAEITAARRLAQRRRFGPYRLRQQPDHKAQREKELRALLRAGFSLSVARQVLDDDTDAS